MIGNIIAEMDKYNKVSIATGGDSGPNMTNAPIGYERVRDIDTAKLPDSYLKSHLLIEDDKCVHSSNSPTNSPKLDEIMPLIQLLNESEQVSRWNQTMLAAMHCNCGMYTRVNIIGRFGFYKMQ